ncbi:PQQ-binding-like beta-propeller repeat protein [Streptomyces sp. NPDC003077]|uniref:outer membrane protein assembly factor BamB family protein n=1 Tax=Streptomyces sp. NPDC003077 TaxID=3154443 RepID=UPI0033B14282
MPPGAPAPAGAVPPPTGAVPPPGAGQGFGPPPTGAAPPPGYGYPQQGPPPGYGYPASPPGTGPGPGFGPPSAHAHVPAYPQAPVPIPVPAPAPKKKSKASLVILMVVALLVLVGAGGGTWYLLSGNDGQVLWSIEAQTKQGALVEAQTRGTWFAGNAVVQTLRDGLKAYDRDTGRQLWATALPGDAQSTCSAPELSTGNIGMVAYGVKQGCNQVAAFDLTTGKELWHKGFKKGIQIARTGDVAVIFGEKDITALNARTGRLAWDPKAAVTEDCGPGVYTGGPALIRYRSCGSHTVIGKWWSEVSSIDPSTGKVKWTYRLESGEPGEEPLFSSSPEIISTSPVVLLHDTGYKQTTRLLALDDATGKVRSTLAGGPPAKYVRSHEESGPWPEAVTVGSTFLLSALDGDDKGIIAAYDLDSGKLLWKTKPGPKQKFFPLPAAPGGPLQAYLTNRGGDLNPQLVEFAKDGTMRTVVEYPTDVDKRMSISAQPYVNRGRLFITCADTRLTFGDEKAYSLVALAMTE